MGRKGPTRGTSLVYESVISWVKVEICSSVRLANSPGSSGLRGWDMLSADTATVAFEEVVSGSVDAMLCAKVKPGARRGNDRPDYLYGV